MTVRFRICLTVWIVTVACTMLCGTTQAEEFNAGDDWTIEISPAVGRTETSSVITNDPLTLPPAADESAAGEDAPAAEPIITHSTASDYQHIYESIPFNRAEYNVNPSYRHDSTMELLTGNARHQTIVRHSTTPIARPQLRYRYLPYRYNNPRRGLNYYFYFPYWNHRGVY